MFWLIRHLDPDFVIWHKLASVWVAAFWGAVGGIIVVLSALLYQSFDWRIGALLIFVSATFAIARFTNQPGAK
jgi:hypothetical protein